MRSLSRYLFFYINLAKRAIKIIQHEGFLALFKKFHFKISQFHYYHTYIHKEDKLTIPSSFNYRPLISIVMPVYNTELTLLKKAISSLFQQSYDRWELCICDDCSTSQETLAYLHQISKLNNKIHIIFSHHNEGISQTTNKAITLAQGQYIGFMDHDDLLPKHALSIIVNEINKKRNADIFYTDNDYISKFGLRFNPAFKPDWSEDMLLSLHYITHFLIVKKSLVKKVGSLKKKFDGVQDYDFILRATELTDKIVHIPFVLYHWRFHEGSLSLNKEKAEELRFKARLALEESLQRRRIRGHILFTEYPSIFRLQRTLFKKPLISIIIPTRDKRDILDACLKSILKKTHYTPYELLVINNSSTKESLAHMTNLQKKGIKIFHYQAPFNFSSIINFGVSKAHGEYIVILNNDTEIITPDWLESLLEHSQREDVGVVSPKLLFPNKKIQHAGVLLHPKKIAVHANYFKPSNDFTSNFIRDYSAVSGACMMFRKSIFLKIGKFDEIFPIQYNDIDFCLRLRKKNYHVIYTPYAELYHYESLTRVKSYDLEQKKVFIQRWREVINKDPFISKDILLQDIQ